MKRYPITDKFKEGDIVLYKSVHMKRGIKVPDQLATFKYIDADARAVILLYSGGALQPQKRAVNPAYLTKVDVADCDTVQPDDGSSRSVQWT